LTAKNDLINIWKKLRQNPKLESFPFGLVLAIGPIQSNYPSLSLSVPACDVSILESTRIDN